MLVLTRKVGEGILIGDDIEIKITKVEGRQVSVAIRAPLSVLVLRSELAARNESICPHGVDKRRECFQCDRQKRNEGEADGNRTDG